MKKLTVKDFNLKYTIECGQFFRYKKLERNTYLIIHQDKIFITKQKNNILFYSNNISKNFIIKFFRLNDNLEKIYKEISTDHIIKKAIKKYHGLRLINQNPFECIISYLCSSASNIPKIQMNIENLSRYFGEKIILENQESFSFPKPKTLNNMQLIKDSKTGFRAKYIFNNNKILTKQFIKKLKQLDYKKAKDTLTKLPGIGNKIADCILLFSLNKLQAFPIDTWIKKALKKYYNQDSNNYNNLQKFAQDKWNNYTGYAQQYLFMMIRNE